MKYGLLAVIFAVSVLVAGCGKPAANTNGVTPPATTNTTTNSGTVPGTTNTSGTTNTTPGTTNSTTNAGAPSGNEEADKAELDAYKSDIEQANGAATDSGSVDDQITESQSELR